jgi:DNA repair protein RecN (Recombination protein N)
MLEDLRIKNFALIDSAALDFKNGFTVLSGETGAGKSLLIGALTFLLGGKGGVEQIRTGCPVAQVSGTFYIKGLSSPVDGSKINEEEIKSPAEWLYVHGIECEDDRVLIRRAVRDNGKAAAWIGDTPVTRADLVSFCSFLVDIHGQHEHQSLMKVSEHRKFLDSYAGINEKVEEFSTLYSNLVSKKKQLEDMLSDDKTRRQKIDVLEFAVKEIDEAKLKPNEDKELDEEETKLSSFEKLFADIQAVNSSLDGSDSGEGAVSLLKKVRSASVHSVSLDPSLEKLDSRLESLFYELSDLAAEYSSYEQSLVFDPDRLAFVQDRQTLIYNLKKKYASSVDAPLEEVLKFKNDAVKRLEELKGGSESRESLEKEIAVNEKNLLSLAAEISEERSKAAQNMSVKVMDVLKNLGMKDARF